MVFAAATTRRPGRQKTTSLYNDGSTTSLNWCRSPNTSISSRSRPFVFGARSMDALFPSLLNFADAKGFSIL